MRTRSYQAHAWTSYISVRAPRWASLLPVIDPTSFYGYTQGISGVSPRRIRHSNDRTHRAICARDNSVVQVLRCNRDGRPRPQQLWRGLRALGRAGRGTVVRCREGRVR